MPTPYPPAKSSYPRLPDIPYPVTGYSRYYTLEGSIQLTRQTVLGPAFEQRPKMNDNKENNHRPPQVRLVV